MICSYLLHGCDVIRGVGRVLMCSSSVQFEDENDVTPGVINMNIPRFPMF